MDSYKNIQAKQASEPLVTQLVAINYANAVVMVATVKSLLARDWVRNSAERRGAAGTNAPQNSEPASRVGTWWPTPGPTRC